MATAKTKTTGRRAAKRATPRKSPTTRSAKVKAVEPAKLQPKPPAKKRQSVWSRSNQRAMYSTPKSGYAKDIGLAVDPDERAGLAVPVATEHGRQEGRLSPAERKYGVARYSVVDATEAQANMIKRLHGELPPIDGGLDVDVSANEDDNMDNEDFDPLGGEPDFEPGSPELEAEERKLAERQMLPQAPKPVYAVSDPPAPSGQQRVQAAPPSALDDFLNSRRRITLELADGAMAMSAITVKESQFGITILLPLLGDGATFIPKPGSEITVVMGEKRWPCFFPGTYFECEELKLLGIVFVKA